MYGATLAAIVVGALLWWHAGALDWLHWFLAVTTVWFAAMSDYWQRQEFQRAEELGQEWPSYTIRVDTENTDKRSETTCRD